MHCVWGNPIFRVREIIIYYDHLFEGVCRFEFFFNHSHNSQQIYRNRLFFA